MRILLAIALLAGCTGVMRDAVTMRCTNGAYGCYNERCIDGVVYLEFSRGGVTVKNDRDGYVVECDKPKPQKPDPKPEPI